MYQAWVFFKPKLQRLRATTQFKQNNNVKETSQCLSACYANGGAIVKTQLNLFSDAPAYHFTISTLRSLYLNETKSVDSVV